MSSPSDAMKSPNHNLREQLERIGLRAVAPQLGDMLAYATEQRWSPRQLFEQLAQIEVAGRAHCSLERRLRTVVPVKSSRPTLERGLICKSAQNDDWKRVGASPEIFTCTIPNTRYRGGDDSG